MKQFLCEISVRALQTDTVVSLDVVLLAINRSTTLAASEALTMIGFLIIHNKLDVSFNHLLAVITNLGILITVAWFTHQLSSHLMELLPGQRTAAFTAYEAITVVGVAFIIN